MLYPQKNDVVSIYYRGKLDNGEIFKIVKKEKPLNAKIGNCDIPPTLEQSIMEMKVGESRKIRVSPDEGYGPRKKDLIQVIDSDELIKKVNPVPGMILSLKIDKDGTEQKIPATVIEVTDSQITVDYNHPLSGHHLTYDLTLAKISRNNGGN